ncbi:DUF3081 domain-containing protein [Psychromonas sp. psych-6C06]|uniref:DUF3081 domain-containing protein n=1 Tax=Psychromonas sp. psych-6C06 TaxID=2058089 RepID=UPI000C34ABF7|nr:DUF3081 domain-containing protein [Psychromonas sp. psych-6C06]PKF63666.1 DUF3081 domain-containing protein [Psychromonas sp. psych-6C06]
MYLDRLKKQNLLEVFDLITSNGNKVDGVYQFEDINASHDFDGYTCWLSYRDLTVSLLFHGSYDFQYENKETLEQFFKKVSNLLNSKNHNGDFEI